MRSKNAFTFHFYSLYISAVSELNFDINFDSYRDV